MAPGAGSSLRDRDTFPLFSGIPSECAVSDKYWKLSRSDYAYAPHRHWCFLGEIEEYNNGLVRVLLEVRDMEGHRLPIYFHTNDRGASIYKNCKEGYTVAVLYAEQHYFLDGTTGLRVEETKFAKIIPHSLKTLLAANDLIFAKDAATKCANCGTTSAALSQCGRCRKVHYCGKECQAAAWAAGHKTECRAVAALAWFTEKNWEDFGEWLALQ